MRDLRIGDMGTWGPQALGTWGPRCCRCGDLDTGGPENWGHGDMGAPGIEAMGDLRVGDMGGLGTPGIEDMGAQTLQMWGLGHRGT